MLADRSQGHIEIAWFRTRGHFRARAEKTPRGRFERAAFSRVSEFRNFFSFFPPVVSPAAESPRNRRRTAAEPPPKIPVFPRVLHNRAGKLGELKSDRNKYSY